MVCFSWVMYTLQRVVVKVPRVWWCLFSLFSTYPILIWGETLQATKSLAALRSSVSLVCILLYAYQRQFKASSQVEWGKDTYTSNNLFLEDCSLGFLKHGAILAWQTAMCISSRPGTVNILGGELRKYKTVSVQMFLAFMHHGCAHKIKVPRKDSRIR